MHDKTKVEKYFLEMEWKCNFLALKVVTVAIHLVIIPSNGLESGIKAKNTEKKERKKRKTEKHTPIILCLILRGRLPHSKHKNIKIVFSNKEFVATNVCLCRFCSVPFSI